MAYDKILDKELFSKTVKFETTKITVSVYSYNEGIPKLQISRMNLDPITGEYKWAKLGRLNKEEAVQVLQIMEEAINNM